MTRDKAIEILADWTACWDASGLLMAFERLGMLKLDEPKDGPQIADCNFGKAFLLFGSERFNSADHMMRAFGAAGLKIVSK